MERTLPRSLETLLKYAAVPYAFGFFTVMLHTAHYGLPVIQLIDPLNLWVGAIPSVVLLLLWWSLKAAERAHSNELARRLVERLGLRKAMALSGTLTLSAIGLLAWALLRIRPLEPNEGSSPRWVLFILVVILAFALKWVQTLLFFGMPWRRGSSAFPTPKWMARALLVVWAVLIAFSILRGYVGGLYPRLPQRFGFGRPASIRLVVDPRKAPQELVESRTTAAAGPMVTHRILLLYRTSQEHIILCEPCKARTLSLNNAAVFGVIWQENTEKQELIPDKK